MKTLRFKTYDLPAHLFTIRKIPVASISPAAHFNPIAALHGNAWQTSSQPPSMQPHPKVIIVQDDAIHEKFRSVEILADILLWLQTIGFRVVTITSCLYGDGANIATEYNHEDRHALLRKLSVFNHDTDYELLAALNIAKDNSTFIDKHTLSFINSTMTTASNHVAFIHESPFEVVVYRPTTVDEIIEALTTEKMSSTSLLKSFRFLDREMQQQVVDILLKKAESTCTEYSLLESIIKLIEEGCYLNSQVIMRILEYSREYMCQAVHLQSTYYEAMRDYILAKVNPDLAKNQMEMTTYKISRFPKLFVMALKLMPEFVLENFEKIDVFQLNDVVVMLAEAKQEGILTRYEDVWFQKIRAARSSYEGADNDHACILSLIRELPNRAREIINIFIDILPAKKYLEMILGYCCHYLELKDRTELLNQYSIESIDDLRLAIEFLPEQAEVILNHHHYLDLIFNDKNHPEKAFLNIANLVFDIKNKALDKKIFDDCMTKIEIIDQSTLAEMILIFPNQENRLLKKFEQLWNSSEGINDFINLLVDKMYNDIIGYRGSAQAFIEKYLPCCEADTKSNFLSNTNYPLSNELYLTLKYEEDRSLENLDEPIRFTSQQMMDWLANAKDDIVTYENLLHTVSFTHYDAAELFKWDEVPEEVYMRCLAYLPQVNNDIFHDQLVDNYQLMREIIINKNLAEIHQRGLHARLLGGINEILMRHHAAFEPNNAWIINSEMPCPTEHVLKLTVWAENSTAFRYVKSVIEAGGYPALREVTILRCNEDCLLALLTAIEKHCNNAIITLLDPIAYSSKEPNSTHDQQLRIMQAGDEHAPAHYPPQKPKLNGLYIANNNPYCFSTKIPTDSSFNMMGVGDVLNPCGQKPQRIRMGLVIRDLNQSTAKAIYFPDFDPSETLPVNMINSKIIEQYKAAQIDDDGRYFLFHQVVEPGINRLYSIDAHEKFLGVIASDSIATGSLALGQGNDYFFYLINNETYAIDVSYVIKAQTQAQRNHRFEQLADDDIVKAIFKQYRSNQSTQSNSDNKTGFPDIDELGLHAWLEQLFEYGSGTCDHRIAALEYRIKQYLLGEQIERIRTINIDNNHVQLEYYTEFGWVTLEAGGLGSRLDYEPEPLSTLEAIAKQVPESNRVNHEVPMFPLVSKNQGQHSNLQQKLKKLIKPASYTNNDEFMALIFAHQHANVGVVTDSLKAHTLQILKQAKQSNINVYVLDSINSLQTNRQTARISANGQVTISDLSDFERYLQQVENDTEHAAMIVVLWDEFSANAQIGMNTLLDPNRSLQGVAIPNHIKVVGFYAAVPTDIALFSRYSVVAKLDYPYAISPTITNHHETHSIDCYGLSDAQAQFLGPVKLDRNIPFWDASEAAIDLLEGKAVNFILKNIADDERDQCIQTIDTALARGNINYHGLTIPIPDNVSISVCNEEFSFLAFAEIEVILNSDYSKIENDKILIVNSTRFDYLLHGKAIHDDVYISRDGVLAQQQNQTLDLWITAPLSASQWYTLFSHATALNIKLRLFLASNISLPSDVKAIPAQIHASYPHCNTVQVILTSHAEAAYQSIRQGNEYVVDVDDLDYQGIIEHIEFAIDSNHFSNFRSIRTELVEMMQNERMNIIFKGHFNEQTLEALHPLLVGHHLELADGTVFKAASTISFIIEVDSQELPNDNSSYEPLAFLGDRLKIMRLHQSSPVPLILHKETNTDDDVLPEAFIGHRIQQLKRACEKYRMVRLIGPTGTGKSYQIKALEADYTIFYGTKSILSWLQAKGDNKAILFLDEVNTEDSQLTWLRPLTTKDEPVVYYAGEFHGLTPNHIVITAENDISYGGGRNRQKLFIDHNIPQIHFDRVPNSVLNYWLKVSLPAEFHDSLLDNPGIIDTLTNPDATRYQLIKQRYRTQYEIPHIDSKFYTPSTAPIYNELYTFVDVRTLYDVQIINGLYLEGPAGCGKSTLIEHVLQQAGYTTHNPNAALYYVKIDATLQPNLICDHVVRAFENGHIIWIDEFNSCSDDGIEATLNSALSGMHPRTGRAAEVPGFAAIFSGNSIALSGRSHFSPALKRRLLTLSMDLPTAEDLRIIMTKLAAEQNMQCDVSSFAIDYHRFMQKNASANLRVLTQHFRELAYCYPANNIQTLFASPKRSQDELIVMSTSKKHKIS